MWPPNPLPETTNTDFHIEWVRFCVHVCVFVFGCVCVSLMVDMGGMRGCDPEWAGVTGPRTWSFSGGWRPGPRDPDCSSRCLPSPHAARPTHRHKTRQEVEPGWVSGGWIYTGPRPTWTLGARANRLLAKRSISNHGGLYCDFFGNAFSYQ